MTRYAMTLLTVGLVLVISQARADDKEDKEKLQGEWLADSLEKNGKNEKQTKGDDYYHTIKIEGDKYHTIVPIWGDQVATFALDSSEKPKTIDIIYKSFGQRGRLETSVRKGLYELDGDTLKICIRFANEKDRPVEFKSKGNVYVITFKRVKK
jgi:uncharacterized protein (TIGR03067 family)